MLNKCSFALNASVRAHTHGTFKPCKTFCSVLPNKTCDVWHFYNAEQ